MKVKIQFTIDVDREAWSDAYDLHTTEEIRADVKSYVAAYAEDIFREIGVLNEPPDNYF